MISNQNIPKSIRETLKKLISPTFFSLSVLLALTFKTSLAEAVPARIDNYNGDGTSFSAEVFLGDPTNICFATVKHGIGPEIVQKLNQQGISVQTLAAGSNKTRDGVTTFCVAFASKINTLQEFYLALEAIKQLTNLDVTPLVQPDSSNWQPPSFADLFNDGERVDVSKLSAIYPDGSLVSGNNLFTANPGRSGGSLYYDGNLIGLINGSASKNDPQYGNLNFLYFTSIEHSQTSRTDAIVRTSQGNIYARDLIFDAR